ncbi:MAG: Fic family protein [Holosporaceae bacterium]|jgi:Fic family protein|nr:Fic family protein [Holosporaceae bacterium]
MINCENIKITHEILAVISELDSFKASWKLFGKLSPEKLFALKKVATIESIGSSTRIEGVKLSDKEIEKLLSNIGSTSFLSRDEQEVAGYSEVCNLVFSSFGEMSFSENLIKQLHGVLLKFSEKDARHSGEYKKLQNSVEAFDTSGKSLGIIFETASPFDTPFQMQDLMNWFRTQQTEKKLHPLILIGIFIVHFLAIHPFQDGNGRLSRIITTLLLMQFGYAYTPYNSLESIIEKNKENYYLSLRKTQITLNNEVDYEPWLLFFLRSLQKQKAHLERKFELEKEAVIFNLSDSSRRIIDVIKERESAGITEIARLTKINKNTIKKHLSALAKGELITKYGSGKSTKYRIM